MVDLLGEMNKIRYETAIGSFSFETVNTVGEDRLVRATIPLTVQGTLLIRSRNKNIYS